VKKEVKKEEEKNVIEKVISMSKVEEEAFTRLHKIKIENEKNNIYIYECSKCSNFLMLH